MEGNHKQPSGTDLFQILGLFAEEGPPHPSYKMLTCLCTVTVLALFVLFFALHLVVKVYSLTGVSDLPLLLSVLSITLALIFMLGFCLLDIAEEFVSDSHWLVSTLGGNTT